MLKGILRTGSLVGQRSFGTTRALQNQILKEAKNPKKFLSPDEFSAAKKTERLEEAIYQEGLLNGEFKYEPKFIGENVVDPVTSRPIPINVELLKYKPINHPTTHGHQVAQLDLKGYDEDSLIRAADFSARAAFYLGIPTSKITTKKTQKRLYTVIKSPFAQAKTKQNFHRTTFHREIIAYDANPEVVDLWLSFINKHSVQGVDYKANITTYESLDFNQTLDNMTPEEAKLPQAYEDTTDPIALKVQELLKSETFKKYLEKGN